MAFWPEIPSSALLVFRTFYGFLQLAMLIHLVPQWRRFFMSEKWGGYSQSSPFVDALQNPRALPVLAAVWVASNVALVSGWQIIPSAVVNLLLCQYFFLFMRWKGVLRGFGAPGYMAYWFGRALLLLEYTSQQAPHLRSLALLVIQVDFALIIFSAAFYKFKSGYYHGEGMDFGLVNPMWSYWPRLFRRLPPGHWFFRGLNHLAWTSQLASAFLMLFPPTRFWGGVLIFLTYLFILTQIRLGFLAEMMLLGALLFCVNGSPGADFLNYAVPPSTFAVSFGSPPLIFNSLLGVFLWTYLALLPVCHAGLFINFYGRRRLPVPLQRALEIYSNFFGIILWRVFSVDHLNFYVNIHHVAPGGERTLLSDWSQPRNLRFWHVGEAITVTSLFTTLKYYPNDDLIFHDRVLRYARTLPCPPRHELIFSYHAIRKETGCYADRPVCEYHVDPRARTIRVVALDPAFSTSAAHVTSPVHAAGRPGSYAPKSS